jgi:glycosyltransferase involved in cell wall biosynthesis
MASKSMIKIAYSGSLDAFVAKKDRSIWDKFKSYFWTYKHQTVDSSTRSAYFLIQAIALLRKQHPEWKADNLKIQLWGNINPVNKKQSELMSVNDVFEFEKYLPKNESLKKLNEADILFLPLEKSNTIGRRTLFIPGKLFEYLNAKKPILALAEPSDCRDILEKSGMAICVEPDRIEAIADVLWQILQNPDTLKKLQANTEYIDSFSFKNKTAELAKIFDSLNVK